MKFESFLAPKLGEFILYRQSLGYKTKSNLSFLKTFDRYLVENNIQDEYLSSDFFLTFRSNLKLEARSVNHILSALRKFFQYMVRLDIYEANPLEDIPSLPQNIVIPYIFSPEETNNLLMTVCKGIRKSKRFYVKDYSVYLAILLMARCGLRISEPLHLKQSHFRRKEKSIYIEETKFRKDRLIPISDQVFIEIKNYLNVRKKLLKKDNSPYLLYGTGERKLCDNRVRIVFHQAVKNIGLAQERQVIGNINFSAPIPHSLRHSFAVATLNYIKQNGKSPRHALPVLSAYMGHVQCKYTMVYLKVISSWHRQELLKRAKSK